jgi:hypothetical protein
MNLSQLCESCGMTGEKEMERKRVSERLSARRCSACAAFPPLARSFLDPVSGKTVRLYECQCGERIWDE